MFTNPRTGHRVGLAVIWLLTHVVIPFVVGAVVTFFLIGR